MVLRRDVSGPQTRWVALVGVLVALAPAVVLTWRGVTWLQSGCGCGGAGMPDWTGWFVLALAAPFYAAAVLLVRAVVGTGRGRDGDRSAAG